MDNPKLVITTINLNAFEATGHVLPSTYIVEFTQAQLDFLKNIEAKGQTIDQVSISTIIK